MNNCIEEMVRLGEDSVLEVKSIRIPGKHVVEPDAKDIADEIAAVANSSGVQPEYRLLGESELMLTIFAVPVDDRKKLRDIAATLSSAKKSGDSITTEETTEEKRVATTEEGVKSHVATEKTTEEILALIRKMPRMPMKEMAARCGITEDGIYWHIKRLREKGMLRRVGPKKGGHWEVVEG